MSSYNSNISHTTVCSQSGATYNICCMVAETISVKCLDLRMRNKMI